jgi:hypothetical protein
MEISSALVRAESSAIEDTPGAISASTESGTSWHRLVKTFVRRIAHPIAQTLQGTPVKSLAAFRSAAEERRPSPLLWRIGFHNDLSRPAHSSLCFRSHSKRESISDGAAPLISSGEFGPPRATKWKEKGRAFGGRNHVSTLDDFSGSHLHVPSVAFSARFEGDPVHLAMRRLSYP